MNKRVKNTGLIKDEALRLGFNACHIAQACVLEDDARRLETWLSKGFHGSMGYMENHFDLRTDPSKLVPGAKSVIVLLMNYYPASGTLNVNPRISKYAYGQDYHLVIKDKLKELLQFVKDNVGEVQGRGFVDSAPVLERSWATRSGLGWIGRNGNLITKQAGSFHFIATLITDLELEYDDPFARDYCGTCTKCVDACPTGAIMDDKVIDGSRCISYYTIELKDMMIPSEMQGKFNDWMFGCDICQDVCPWNRFSTPTNEPAFNPLPELLNLGTREWEEMTEESFRRIFGKSPLKRAKLSGIQRNVRFLKERNQDL